MFLIPRRPVEAGRIHRVRQGQPFLERREFVAEIADPAEAEVEAEPDTEGLAQPVTTIPPEQALLQQTEIICRLEVYCAFLLHHLFTYTN